MGDCKKETKHEDCGMHSVPCECTYVICVKNN